MKEVGCPQCNPALKLCEMHKLIAEAQEKAKEMPRLKTAMDAADEEQKSIIYLQIKALNAQIASYNKRIEELSG